MLVHSAEQFCFVDRDSGYPATSVKAPRLAARQAP
jgi:hypothetical protein